MSKIYGVYYAYSKWEVLPDDMCSDPNIPRYPVELARVIIYSTPLAQIEAYANTMCPASQFIEADTQEEFDRKVEEMKNNFADDEWVKENIDHYL